MDDRLHEEVPALLRDACARLMTPRWRALAAGDIEEKSPGEVVTVVDRAVEQALSPALRALVPGSRVVGEEACALDPALLRGVQEGTVWLLDPLDGTANFVAGRETFGVLAALIRQGELVASWMFVPCADTLYAAGRGAGAWCNGARFSVAPTGGLRAGIVRTRFLPADIKDTVVAGAAALGEVQPGAACTAIDYPAVAAGESGFALYWRTLPWDHATPALWLREAGGHVARLDGSAYAPAQEGEGLLVAGSPADWHAAHRQLGLR